MVYLLYLRNYLAVLSVWDCEVRNRKLLFFLFLVQCEMTYKRNPRLLNQFQYCEREAVPFLVIVGEDEMSKGGVQIREVNSRKDVRIIIIIL